jgi:putative membrane protein
MIKLKSVPLSFGVLLYACASLVSAQGNTPSSSSSSSNPTMVASAAFVAHAWQDNDTEVQLGKLAQQKSQSADVKAFGERMVKDHGKAIKELIATAAKKGVPAPTVLDKEHAAVVEEMHAMSGAQFDAAYSKAMVDAHTAAIQLFKDAANSKDIDPDLAKFAQKTLPVLQQHKKMADELAAKHASGH